MSDVKTYFDPDWAKKDLGAALYRLEKLDIKCRLYYHDWWTIAVDGNYIDYGTHHSLEDCARLYK